MGPGCPLSAESALSWGDSLAERDFIAGYIQKKLADKPGSVVDSHSSRRTVARRSSHLPADSASSVIARLFGVAPDGGCRVSPARR